MLKILNFRELAKGLKNKEGKSIRSKTVFRSGALAYAAKSDILKLKYYGVRDIYDFRSENEISHMPALTDSHFTTHHFDILEEAANSDAAAYINMTREELNGKALRMYSEDFPISDGYADAVQKISAQTNPEFLFHCTAGKDRTGIFGAIFMMILDFDLDEVKKEYNTIDKRSMKILGKHLLKKIDVSPKDVDISKFEGVMGVLPEFIEAYFDTIIENHKTIDEYILSKVGVTPEIKSELKKRYLV